MTNRPRIAVIGCGAWGRNLVRNFAALNALYAVCDTDTALAAEHARSHGVKAQSLQTILADPNVDAVAIASPAITHYETARACLESGKDIFVEKSLATSLEHGRTIAGLAKRRNRVLMVGHLLQYHAAYCHLQEMISRGDLGQLLYVYSNRLNLGRLRQEENILWSFAPHGISMILGLFNEVPKRVDATGGYYVNPDVADVTTTHLHFSGERQAQVFVSWLHPYKEQKLVAICADGMVTFDDAQPWAEKLTVFRHRLDWNGRPPRAEKADAEPIPLPESEPLRAECAHFIECVQHRLTPRTDASEALNVLDVLTRAQAALSRPRTLSEAE